VGYIKLFEEYSNNILSIEEKKLAYLILRVCIIHKQGIFMFIRVGLYHMIIMKLLGKESGI